MNALEQLEEKGKRGMATELELCILMAGSLNDQRHAAQQLVTLQTNCDNAIKANIEVAKLNIDLQERVEELTRKTNDRFVRCTWCGWKLDFHPDEQTKAYEKVNAHALVCEKDPRTSQLRKLADALTDHDTDQQCVFCSKTEWGADNHEENCPTRMAYIILNEQDGRK